MRRWLLGLSLVLVSLTGGPLQGQSRFVWAPEHQHAAAVLSNVTLGAQLAGEAWHVWEAPSRSRAASCAGLRIGTAFLATEGLKRLVGKDRPNHRDHFSMPSGHTSMTMAASGWSYGIGIPLSFTTGGLRRAANEHDWWDVLGGAGVGLLANLWCRGDDGYGRK